MDLLLDTHTLIWFFNGDSLLPENVKEAIRLVRQLGLLSHKSCGFSGFSLTKPHFLAEVVRKLKFPNNSIIESQNRKFVSMVSVWEFAIKISLNKLVFDGKTQGFLELINNNGFELLPINKGYILELEKLPFIHRDPFDRLLVATAISENMRIVTADANIQKYPVHYIWQRL